ncbi:MAG: carboxypeptidase-like regulatory domain-containing protein [Chloroflexota bacterium]|nr:carboxypeptidase-like regulatory domain-containing protein [Chloroflexota bacterium]
MDKRAILPVLAAIARRAPLPLAIALIASVSWYHFVFPGFNVEGRVLEMGTGAPLANARVVTRTGETTTDAAGYFQLQGAKPPSPIRVHVAGYGDGETRLLDPRAPAVFELAPEQAAPRPTPVPIETAVLATVEPVAAALPVPTPAPTPDSFRPLLPEHRIVAYYGNPLAKQMGILGELAPTDMLSQLKQQAAAITAADRTRSVLPALELVTPAAQADAGEDGLYRARMKPELIEQVAQWAEANQALLILDVQPGRSSVAEEVSALLPFLHRPYVHLALDPEFAMPEGRAPGEVVGSMDASVVNATIRTLADLVNSEHLPPKVLIVHRFTEGMLTNYAEIKPDPHVQVVVTMDGFGSPQLKLAQYDEYVHNQAVEHAGIKLFYHHDVPILTPQQVVELDPFPDLVIYQ